MSDRDLLSGVEAAAAGTPDIGFGVYVHWPFCARKCPYCDFNSHVRPKGIDEAGYLAAWFRYFPKTRTVCFPTNFYVPILSKLSVVHKQTSFSRMTTEMNCNLLALQNPLGQPQQPQPQMDPSMQQYQWQPQQALVNQTQVPIYPTSPYQ